MFRSKTIFVVGAGASCELGFPNGTELLGQIASALDIYFGSGFNMERGDRRIYEAYTRLSTSAGVAANEYQQAGWRIRDAAHLGLSIDNVINQFVDDPLVAPVGKLAIAQRILFAEQRSVLRLSRDRVEGVEALAQARTTWLGGFAQLLVQDKTRARLDDLFDNVSIVSFNYDRSIRRFLPLALMSQFGLPQPDANELTKKLQIYHPYGSLGPLPWENTAGGAEYGDAEYASLGREPINLLALEPSSHP
jgi:hypothetical protein